MTDLSSLIERIEKSEGADRELDVLIAEESGQVPPDMERSWNFGWWRGVRDNRQWLTPDYTASLDAALTLVPEGFDFGCGSPDCTGMSWAWVGKRNAPKSTNFDSMHSTDAATPALALCAAALKARSPSHEG